MNERDQQWREVLTAQLGLDPVKFQLSRPSPLLATGDEILWDYFDAVPPAGPVFDRSGQPWSRLSAQHDRIVNQLGFAREAVFAAHVGAGVYAGWCEYLNRKAAGARLTELPSVFLNWAMLHSPASATSGSSLLARGFLAGKSQPSQGVEFESATLSKGGETGFTAQFEAAKVRVNAKISGWAVYQSRPGAWFNAAAMRLALANPGSPRWGRDAGCRWDDFFGPQGSLMRAIAALVVADGIRASVKYDAAAGRTQSEQQVSQGVWPFFVPDPVSQGDGVANRVESPPSGGMLFTLATKPGDRAVIGSLVVNIDEYVRTRGEHTHGPSAA